VKRVPRYNRLVLRRRDRSCSCPVFCIYILELALFSPFPPALLALADGTVFYGTGIGATGNANRRVVFNTAMTGYQEDPHRSLLLPPDVTLTYPHIGNTGVNREDRESTQVHTAGLVIRDLPLRASNWRTEQSLSDYLKSNKVVAIAGIDTRKLTRILRTVGAQSGCLLPLRKVKISAKRSGARARQGARVSRPRRDGSGQGGIGA